MVHGFRSINGRLVVCNQKNRVHSHVDCLSELRDVISVIPAMRPNARSSGVATVAAMTSGLAPGTLAFTEIVG